MEDDKPKTFLATTALEEFWDTSQPMLFLGEWCRSYEKQSSWETLDAEVLSHPLLEETYSSMAYDYPIQVYKKLLPEIANLLNHIHKTKHSLRYWKIVVGPFLLIYICTVYQRYIYLKAAYKSYPLMDTIGLHKNSYITLSSPSSFESFEDSLWNLQIFTQIICFSFKTPSRFHSYTRLDHPQVQEKTKKTPNFFFKKLKRLGMKFITRWFCKRTIAFLPRYFFPKKNLYLIMWFSRLRILPILFPLSKETAIKSDAKSSLDFFAREKFKQLSTTDHFSALILHTLSINMPLIYIEHYQKMLKKIKNTLPINPGVIVGDCWVVNNWLKFWGAEKAEKGAKLVSIQHGGGYGILSNSIYEFLERDNVDFFISWGWKGDNVIGGPCKYFCEQNVKKYKKPRSKKNSIILWAVTTFDEYTYFYKHYISLQIRLITNLDSNITPQIIMRPPPGITCLTKLKDTFKSLTIRHSKDKDSFFEQLSSAKIFISDNLNTTFYAALGLNIPTILFWGEKPYVLSEAAMPLFVLLKKVGIYHDSPESAAKMLNKIADNPEIWWHSEETQKSRLAFCQQHVRTSSNWLKEWADIFSKIR